MSGCIDDFTADEKLVDHYLPKKGAQVLAEIVHSIYRYNLKYKLLNKVLVRVSLAEMT